MIAHWPRDRAPMTVPAGAPASWRILLAFMLVSSLHAAALADATGPELPLSGPGTSGTAALGGGVLQAPSEGHLPKWPRDMMGDSVQGPYVAPFAIEVSDSCRGFPVAHLTNPILGGHPISPKQATLAMEEGLRLHSLPFPLTTHAAAPGAAPATSTASAEGNLQGPNTKSTEGQEATDLPEGQQNVASASIVGLQNLTVGSPLRALLYQVEGGLGNNLLQAYFGLTYAFLSGRRLLRQEEGAWVQGLQAMCTAFHCSAELMPPTNISTENATQDIQPLEGENLFLSISDPRPLLVLKSHSLRLDPLDREPHRQCLLQSFHCTSIWCLKSRQLRAFLGMPHRVLGEVLHRNMAVAAANTEQVLPWKEGWTPLQDWQAIHMHVASLLDEMRQEELRFQRALAESAAAAILNSTLPRNGSMPDGGIRGAASQGSDSVGPHTKEELSTHGGGGGSLRPGRRLLSHSVVRKRRSKDGRRRRASGLRSRSFEVPLDVQEDTSQRETGAGTTFRSGKESGESEAGTFESERRQNMMSKGLRGQGSPRATAQSGLHTRSPSRTTSQEETTRSDVETTSEEESPRGTLEGQSRRHKKAEALESSEIAVKETANILVEELPAKGGAAPLENSKEEAESQESNKEEAASRESSKEMSQAASGGSSEQSQEGGELREAQLGGSLRTASTNTSEEATAGTEQMDSKSRIEANETGQASEGSSERSEQALSLQFDVALHIRTLTPCVEYNPFKAGCRGWPMEELLSKAYSLPAFKPFLEAKDWVCISSLLVYLHRVKLGMLGPGTPPADLHKRQMEFPEGSKSKVLLDRFLKTVAPGPVSGMWTAADALALAQGALPLVLDQDLAKSDPEAASNTSSSGSTSMYPNRGRLKILLATDNEALRPLFVEFLRPFGTVVFSKGEVAHTGTWRRAVKEDNERLMEAKLESLSEFFLLSKAAVALNFGARPSSFLASASQYGNSTLIIRGKLPYDRYCNCPCCFAVEHWAESVQ